MTTEEIKELVVTPYEEVGIDAIAPALEDIENWLKKIAPWGLNPTGVSLRNFDIQGILQTPAATPFPFISGGPEIVFKHKSTGKMSIHQAYPPMGRQLPFFHFATANTLVSLAQ